MPPTVYLISGANRGIGLGLVKALAKRENVIIFAGARDPSCATELKALVQEFSGKVRVIKIVAADEAGNRAAIEEIRSKAGRLDVVIANAAISNYYGTVMDVPIQAMRDHFEVNTIGPLVLFQASYPLLKASTPTPKFTVISSRGGSVEFGPSSDIPIVAYGPSKAALNYLARKLHYENNDLVVVIVCPGVVSTDMSEAFRSRSTVFDDLPVIPMETTVASILQTIDAATRPEKGPAFHGSEGIILPW